MKVRLDIPIEPQGKGRPRATVDPRTGRAKVYTPNKTRQWEARLALMAQEKLGLKLLEGPIYLEVAQIRQRPKTLCRRKDPEGLIWCPKRPDVDNVRKGVMDALKTFWRDDAQVCCGPPWKLYSEKQGRARMVVIISDELDALLTEANNKFAMAEPEAEAEPASEPTNGAATLDLFAEGNHG